MSRIRLYAVVGNPIWGSLSPTLMNAGLVASGINAKYLKLLSHPERPLEIISAARRLGLEGLNVTSPFKETLLGAATELTHVAAKIRATNLLRFTWKDGQADQIVAYNTDPAGVIGAVGRPLPNSVLILGAGGAARSAVEALEGQSHIYLWNRSHKKALELFSNRAVTVIPGSVHELSSKLPDVELVISCLPGNVSIPGNLKLRPGTRLLDANYQQQSAQRQALAAQGVKLIDGRNWLLHQAIAGFQLLTDNTCPAEALLAALKGGAERPIKKKGLALIGLPASGKSTLARELGQLRGLFSSTISTDSLIEARSGRSIESFFETDGEAEFRRLEEEGICGIVPSKESFILLDCGGGAIISRAVRRHLSEHFQVLWLTASTETTLARLALSAPRPILKGHTDPVLALRIIEESRREFYATTADAILSTEGLTPNELSTLVQAEIS